MAAPDLRIKPAPPNLEELKRARRFLRGAATLLAEASNGDEFLERLAGEASTLALMAEIAVKDWEER